MIDANDLVKAIGAVAGVVVTVALGWLGYKKKSSANDASISTDSHTVDFMDRQSERIKVLEERNDALTKTVAESGMWKIRAELTEARVAQLEQLQDSLKAELISISADLTKWRKRCEKLKLLLVKNNIDIPETEKEEG